MTFTPSFLFDSMSETNKDNCYEKLYNCIFNNATITEKRNREMPVPDGALGKRAKIDSSDNRYTDAKQYLCAGKNDFNHARECHCTQEILREQMDPSLKKLINEQEILVHHYGYVIPKHSELDVLPLAQKFIHPRDQNIVFYDPSHNPVHKYIFHVVGPVFVAQV